MPAGCEGAAGDVSPDSDIWLFVPEAMSAAPAAAAAAPADCAGRGGLCCTAVDAGLEEDAACTG